jgi:hypothetical protein
VGEQLKYVQIAGMIVPLLVVAIGMASWIFSLRADLDVVINEVAEVSLDTARVNADANEGDEALMERIEELEATITEIATTQSVITNEYRTIMADHSGFAETLQRMEASGALPTGERRAYGGYSK